MSSAGRGWNDSHPGMTRSGFSLIELLVVLFVIGLATVLVSPALTKGLSSVRLKTAARDVSATMRYARSLAVSKAREQVVNFDISEGRYWLNEETSAMRELPPDVHFIQVSTPEGDIRTGRAEIIFYPMGSTSGGSVWIGGDRPAVCKIQTRMVTGVVELTFEG